ncbi:MAG: 4-(cytidine 5'-diphospho)-2-C-methyl-D-erythritol kinase, partial [Oscillospiraceae bacterium]|nr:4-(cytidine 5'-diphospho)-2-C-methyl-D-erythritol kinase [Oscillospiraceae bacterium]
IIMTAPAKINLTLNVTGKRPDGYHDLCTIMQSISLCDTVEISANSSGFITVDCTDKSIPCGEAAKKNIAYKAAAAFYGCTEISRTGVHIKIEKHIPSEAGLGGGSSDGAAVIIGMNKLYGTNLSESKLCGIGLNVGADVPFCIAGGTKLCYGIGECISPAPPLEDCFIVIGKGSNGISTKEAYEKIDRLDNYDVSDSALYDGTLSSLGKTGGNIFEKVTENSDVSEIKKICREYGAVYYAMSGSGSAVFGLFNSRWDAEKCFLHLKERDFFAKIRKPLTHGAKILKVY